MRKFLEAINLKQNNLQSQSKNFAIPSKKFFPKKNYIKNMMHIQSID